MLLPVSVGNKSNDQETGPGTAVLLNLHLPMLENSQYITLSDGGQHSTRRRCYFHHQQKHFLDYFDDPDLDGTVIMQVDNLFQYSEKEGTYTEVWDNPTGNVSLATSRG